MHKKAEFLQGVRAGIPVIPDSSRSLIASTLLCAFVGVFFVDPDGGKEETHES